MVRLAQVPVEPLVPALEQAGDQHGVLGDHLVVVQSLLALFEQVKIVKVHLFNHTVDDVADAHLLAKFVEQGARDALVRAHVALRIFLLLSIVLNRREADLVPKARDATHERIKDVLGRVKLLERGDEDLARAVEDFI